MFVSTVIPDSLFCDYISENCVTKTLVIYLKRKIDANGLMRQSKELKSTTKQPDNWMVALLGKKTLLRIIHLCWYLIFLL